MICPERPGLVFFLVSCFIIVWGFRIFVFDIPDAVASVFHGTPDRLEVEREFVQQAMNVEFPAPIDYEPIREICARTQFRPGLVFSCEGQHGGIGMVRNQILKCVRYAIHGGGALVIPSMALRNAKNLADIETSTEVPLDYLLDRDTFVSHLSKGCPGMQLYDHADDFPAYKHRVGEPLHILGDQFEPDHPREGLRHPRQWREFFDNWLEEKSVKLSAKAPVHVKFEQSFLEYPVQDDGVAFVNEFGKILSYRNDTRALAAKVLYEMKRRFSLPIDPKTAMNPGAYYGAHLRLESDAIWAWPPEQWRYSRMDEQFEQQFQNLERSGLGVVYVASGNQTVVDMFAEAWGKRIAAHPGSGRKNVTVVTKHDLLQGHDKKRLDGMTFDQQALVDFMVMFKASAFMGVAHSSFPWTVALRRHELSKYTNYANEGSDLLRDEYSVIMGMQADYPDIDPFVTGIWP